MPATRVSTPSVVAIPIPYSAKRHDGAPRTTDRDGGAQQGEEQRQGTAERGEPVREPERRIATGARPARIAANLARSLLRAVKAEGLAADAHASGDDQEAPDA
jgi:hypothetical protein